MGSMRSAFVVVATMALSLPPTTAVSQEGAVQHNATSAPAGARFEIVQSGLAAKWTFRLDRFSGRVWQLVSLRAGGTGWEAMEVRGLERTPPGQARFQIFTSGLAAKHTFLIDTTAGRTWVLVTGRRKAEDGASYEVTVWDPFDDEK